MAHSIFQSQSALGKIATWVGEAYRTKILSSVVQGKPLWAQLNITDKCNLDCGYCSEHDKHGEHVPFETVVEWIEHARKLGIHHLQFIGGEPLLHPRFQDLVTEAHARGITTGLTTNGFLLHRFDVGKLKDLGLSRIQVSVDSLKPNQVTSKALSVIRPILESLQSQSIWLRVNTVVTLEGMQECQDLGYELFNMGIPTAFSPAHIAGRLPRENPIAFLEFFEWVLQCKSMGSPVDMPTFLIRYYQAWYAGESSQLSWSCEGGARAFYVDSKGGFRYCTHTPKRGNFLDTTPGILQKNRNVSKGCEDGCGVQCMVINSLPFHQPLFVLSNDVFPWMGRKKTRNP